MDIRILTAKDGGAVQQLWLRGLGSYPDAFGPSYEALVAMPRDQFVTQFFHTPPPHAFFLGTWFHEQLVGMLRFSLAPGAQHRHIGHVSALYVVPEVRNQGIGTQLLHTAIAQAVLLPHLTCVTLTVINSAGVSSTWYRARGFAPAPQPAGSSNGQPSRFAVYWYSIDRT